MSTKGMIFLVSLPIPILAAVFWHDRVYSLYRLLDDPAEKVGYYWFSFRLQNPWLSRQLPGHVEPLSSIPDDPERVASVRRQIRIAHLIMGAWVLLSFALFALTARH
jgi:hypothetical protein